MCGFVQAGQMQVMAAILSDGELNSMVLTFLVQVPEVDHRLSASTWTQFGPLSPTQPPSMCCCHLTLASQYTYTSAPFPWCQSHRLSLAPHAKCVPSAAWNTH